VIPNGDVAQGREQIEALLEPQFRASPTGTSSGAAFMPAARRPGVERTVTGTHAGEFMGTRPRTAALSSGGCSSFRFTCDGLIAVEDLYHFDDVYSSLRWTRDNMLMQRQHTMPR
jgi:hypothetical protein